MAVKSTFTCHRILHKKYVLITIRMKKLTLQEIKGMVLNHATTYGYYQIISKILDFFLSTISRIPDQKQQSLLRNFG